MTAKTEWEATFQKDIVRVCDVAKKLLTRAILSGKEESNIILGMIRTEQGYPTERPGKNGAWWPEDQDFLKDEKIVTTPEVIEWYNNSPFAC